MIVWGVVGRKNSGKTGLVERLITEFTTRGLRVSTIKHAHHAVDIDQPGRDSFRHRQAGAGQVLLSSARRWALMTELNDAAEPKLEDLLAHLAPVDLVLVEGYKAAQLPKIEAHRPETGQSLLAPGDQTIRAIATTGTVQADRPVFHLDQTAEIAAFIRREARL